jgi:hypothetical protein
VGRIETLQSQGGMGTMEYWDLVGTADKVYFVRIASGIPMLAGIVAGVTLVEMAIYSMHLPAAMAYDTGRNYTLGAVAGIFIFVVIQAVIMHLMATGKRAMLSKLPPAKACEDSGGFSMDWNELRSHRLVKGKLTIYTTKLKKTFALGRRMADLDKLIRAHGRSKGLGVM